MTRFASAALLLLIARASADELVPLFNGKDLTGWVNVNGAPGTFFVKDGEIITTGKPTGFLRTVKQYENFELEMEWMHVNKTEVGNSGLFVWGDPLPAQGSPYTRGIEVQVLVNLTYTDKKTGAVTASSHGDVFSIWGAVCKPDRPHPTGGLRCIPSENRAKGGGEWNHYKVIANDGVIKLHVNGKEVSGVSACKPRKGYLALESEGAECHFRNIRIRELPSTNPKPEEVAEVADDHRSLYTGLDLSGWKVEEKAAASWKPKDWVLSFDGKVDSAALTTEAEFGDAEFVCDFKFPAKSEKPGMCTFNLRDGKGTKVSLKLGGGGVSTTVMSENTASGSGTSFDGLKPAGQFNRLRAVLKGGELTVTVNGKKVPTGGAAIGSGKGTFGLAPAGAMDFANIFVRDLK